MKKYIIPLFMFIFSFILAGNVNAKTYNVTINFDVNEKFNYFYKSFSNLYTLLFREFCCLLYPTTYIS